MAEPILSVLFLWHQHQPFYKDPLSNHYELPWVRLHATKDYYDMVALLDDYPKIRANFNLVPSLLAQLDDYAQNQAHDRFLALSIKAASALSFDERSFILKNFFMANWERMIDPFPRYHELLEKRGRSASDEDLSRVQTYFKEQDWRDLQTWFNLSWMDPYWKNHDEFIRSLFEKGKGFSEEDKQKLAKKQLEICGAVVPKHRAAAERGQIEVTASPFYHPILPLLIDSNAALMAMPQVTLPRHHHAFPEDARDQIRKALDDHEKRFGQRPKGMWPSEGSVSEAAAGLLMESGVEWAATDEAVLAQSLDPATFRREDIYEPYQWTVGGKTLNFFFRDHELSDAIGFRYAGWNADDAAADFIQKLHGIRERLKTIDGDHPRPHVVPVILDGENCWEYYQDDGVPFLRALYQRLSDDPLIETVRGSDYLKRPAERRTLKRLWSGSWINSNFGIWIGHSEDNRAWDFLFQTRAFLQAELKRRPDLATTDAGRLAMEEIYIAEGSDWCWWYGDDHSSENDAVFDYLFRKHLMNVYSLLGSKIPEDLQIPIKAKRGKAVIKTPVDFVTPKLDGRVTSYFEWQSAGFYETDAGATGTMHRAQNWIKSIHYGFDMANLYLRLDLSKPLDLAALQTTAIKITFIKPQGVEIEARIKPDETVAFRFKGTGGGNEDPKAQGAAKKIIELAIPLNRIGTPDSTPEIKFIVQIEKDGQPQERWPSDAALHFDFPTPDSFSESWII